ncbi:hypothetical protein MKX03_002925 [Papaver bracteatum]|nr:hypothetical protein MKX03_002925 [Papaver bracteatum]
MHLLCSVLIFFMMIPNEVSAETWVVGGSKGWVPNLNYSIWAESIKVYKDDSLLFVYDKYRFSVLEVREIDYISCELRNLIQNCSSGNGKDLVPLTQTKRYYFISGIDLCFEGMKLQIDVMERPPQPPSSNSRSSTSFGFVVLSLLLNCVF